MGRILSIEPVDRSSRMMTSCPASKHRSARWEPMNPAPPVISTLMQSSLIGLRYRCRRGRPPRFLRRRPLFVVILGEPHFAAQYPLVNQSPWYRNAVFWDCVVFVLFQLQQRVALGIGIVAQHPFQHFLIAVGPARV